MKSKHYFILFFLFIVHCSFGQSYHVTGKITDETSQKPVDNVKIYDIMSGKTLVSEKDGTFSFTSTSDTIDLEFKRFNYVDKKIKIYLTRDTALNVFIVPNVKMLKEVLITANNSKQLINSINLNKEYLNAIPSLGGEKDILKSFQYTPGVISGNEGTNSINVRGGSDDQNLYLIDGMPVYNSSHLLGFFSAVNSDIVESAELIRGGLPSNYGGKLSSVININTVKPSYEKINGDISLGLVSAKLFLNFPIIKKHSGLIISARRSFFDALTGIIAKSTNSDEMKKIGFYDIDIKYDHKLNLNNSVSFQYILSNDFFYSLYGNNTDGYNDLSGLKWYSNTCFLNFNHNFSNSDFKFLVGVNNYSYDYLNKNYTSKKELESSYSKESIIRDILIKSEYNYHPNTLLNIMLGASQTFHRINPLKMIVQDNLIFNNNSNSSESSIYMGININVKENIFSLGLRQSAYISDSAKYFPLEPRIAFSRKINDLLSIKTSVTRNVQFIHRVQDFSTVLPVEIWYASNENLKYEDSYQYSFEINRKIIPQKFEINAAIYYKWMTNLVEYGTYYSDFQLTPLSETLVSGGIGKAYGLELYGKYNNKKLTSTFSYLLSRSLRKFETLNHNNWFPADFDRLHNFNLMVTYELKSNILLSLGWMFASGKPVTIPEGKYFLNDGYTDGYYYTSSKNNYRLKDFHKLDISIQFKKNLKHGYRVFEVSVYNAYNRMNPYTIGFAKVNNSDNTTSLIMKQYTLFPIIPSISYTRNF